MSVRLNMVAKCLKGNRHDRINTVNDPITGEKGRKEKEVGLEESMSVGKCLKGNRHDRLNTVNDPNTGEKGEKKKRWG